MMGKLALLTVILDVYAQIKALPPECDPYVILLKEEESCHKELWKHNTSISVNFQTVYEDPQILDQQLENHTFHGIEKGSPTPVLESYRPVGFLSYLASDEPHLFSGCKGMWDHLNCWPYANIGETISQPCPAFLHTNGEVFRNCTAQGWTEPYPPHEIACEYAFNDNFTFLGEVHSHLYFFYVKTMYTVGYAISLTSLSIAIVILCVFRKLHCTRNYIHIQLFLSFILRAAFIFIKDSVLFSKEDFYHCNYYPVGCKLVLLSSHYCIMANYSWLLVEGHYLHTLVYVSFFSRRLYFWLYMTLGWGSPAVIIVAWGLAKYFYEDEGCWETRKHTWIWWILRVPVLLFIIINLLFFISITRTLVGKLRTPDVRGNEYNQYKKLAKSTFLLVSLFGLQYILFAFFPEKVSDLTYKIWNFVELALASTQGFVVAILYCFLNGEVQHEFQRKWRRWRLMQSRQGGRQYNFSLSQSGTPLTQVSLLTRGPAASQS